MKVNYSYFLVKPYLEDHFCMPPTLETTDVKTKQNKTNKNEKTVPGLRSKGRLWMVELEEEI